MAGFQPTICDLSLRSAGIVHAKPFPENGISEYTLHIPGAYNFLFFKTLFNAGNLSVSILLVSISILDVTSVNPNSGLRRVLNACVHLVFPGASQTASPAQFCTP
jgi:hypothetical protein